MKRVVIVLTLLAISVPVLATVGVVKIYVGKQIVIKSAVIDGPVVLRIGFPTSPPFWLNLASGLNVKGKMGSSWTYNFTSVVALTLGDTSEGPTPIVTTVASDNTTLFRGNRFNTEHKLLLDYNFCDKTPPLVPSGYSFATYEVMPSRWALGAQSNWKYREKLDLWVGPLLEAYITPDRKALLYLCCEIQTSDFSQRKVFGEIKFPIPF